MFVGAATLVSHQLVHRSLALSYKSPAQLGSTREQLSTTRQQLSKCKFLEHVQDDGTHAANQADRLHEQYLSLRQILDQKFEPTEITYSRYLDGLTTAVLALSESLLQLKNSLENLNRMGPAAKNHAQLSKIREQAATVESGLQALTTLFESLNQVTTKETYLDRLDQTMANIKDLADRAQRYSKSNDIERK